MNIATIHERLTASNPEDLQWEGFRKAAVVVPLLETKNGLEILFTVRSSTLSHHAGDVAFPGGRIDKGESVQEAACRECWEELGLNIIPDDFLGRLDDHPSPAKYTVTPFVTLLPKTELNINQSEVASTFTVELTTLQKIRPTTKDVDTLGKGRERRLHFYRTSQHVIWGMTGNIVTNFLNVIEGNASHRPWLIPEPKSTY